jgi:beta-phosphoglucomutase family hydrolase
MDRRPTAERDWEARRTGTNSQVTLGLPPGIRACLFDLDGVLTKTATVHAAAWADTFDALLRDRSGRTGEAYVPFDPVGDYLRYVDGRPREDGVRTFLSARGIELPEGGADDPPGLDTVHAVARRKNDAVQERLRRDGVVVYEDARRYVKATADAGLGRAVVTASANAQAVLQAAALDGAFDVLVDGVVARDEHLRGKPHADTFVAAARRLDVEPAAAAVFEDAIAGVQAGREGAFGWVVGLDRDDDAEHADALVAAGADVAVRDLDELRVRAG